MINTLTIRSSSEIQTDRAARVVPAFMAAFLGALFIWGVGFSSVDVFHNAAHDTRHSNVFPCH